MPDDCPPARAAVGKIEIATLNCLDGLHPVGILINGRKVASLEKEMVVLAVREGDEVLIDGSRQKERLTFRIKRLSPEVLWPPSDYLVTTNLSKASLGRVKMRNSSEWGD